MALPNLLICGVNKGGTTSLYSYLVAHPDIAGGKVKEACHFLTYRYGEPPLPLDDYRRNYDGVAAETRYLIDATPGYFYGGARVVDAIRSTLGPAKAIIVFRDPIERVWSFYRFMKSMMKIEATMGFDEYLDQCLGMPDDQLAGRDANPFWGVAGGHYIRWLPAWRDGFGDDLKILFIDDLRTDPAGKLTEIEDWLGLPRRLAGVKTGVENRTIAFRFARLHALGLSVNRLGEPLFRRLPFVKRAIRSLYNNVNEKAVTEKLGAEARARLEREYAPSNAALKQYLQAMGMAAMPKWLASAR